MVVDKRLILRGCVGEKNRRRPQVLVVGCGCLGAVFSARLSQSADVCCYETSSRVVRAVRRHGLIVSDGTTKTITRMTITASMTGHQGRMFDGVIVVTKCHDMRVASEVVVKYCRTKRVAFLQNGDFSLGWAKRLWPGTDICRGVTTMAVRSRSDAVVDIAYRGHTYMGAYAGKMESVRWFADLFRKSGMETSTVMDYRRAVWSKLIFSAVMNPLPILLAGGYELVCKDWRVYRIVCQAIQEGKQVARALGIALVFDPMTIVRSLRDGKLDNRGHQGSMYYDFIARREIELEPITGALIAHARRAGVETPALDMVYALTKILEEGRAHSR